MSHNDTLLPLVVHLLAGGLAGWVASWLWQRLHRYAPGPCPTLAPGQVAPQLVLLTEDGPAPAGPTPAATAPLLRLVA